MNLSVKKFENRSTFGKVMDNIIMAYFFDSQCSSWHWCWLLNAAA